MHGRPYLNGAATIFMYYLGQALERIEALPELTCMIPAVTAMTTLSKKNCVFPLAIFSSGEKSAKIHIIIHLFDG